MKNDQDTSIKILVLLQNKCGEFLLLKEKIEKNPESRYNFIRGTYDRSGEVIIETAKRECLEEAGIENFDSFELSDIREFYAPEKTRIYYIFEATTKETPKISSFTEQQKLNEKILSAQWTTKDRIEMMKENDFVDPIVFTIAQSIGK